MAIPPITRELVLRILNKGVAGDAALLYRWLVMYYRLSQSTLAFNFAEFKETFSREVQQFFQGLDIKKEEDITEQAIEEALQLLHQEKKVELIAPYNEYRLVSAAERCKDISPSEIFFACNELKLNPLQYIRSRIIRFCECHYILPEHKDEIVIAAIEAAENAVKYSNEYVIYLEQQINQDSYQLKIYNGVAELDLSKEINRGKFSEDVSLMRGILVMSKLLDHLDIIRNVEKRRVEFVGIKKVSFTNH